MKDMTKGPITRHIITYAIPILLGNMMQLAYNAIDSIIAGRFIGKEALAAEGIVAPIMNLIILAISGMCIGAGILLSEHFGEGNHKAIRKIMGNLLYLGIVISLITTLIVFLCTPILLSLLNTPENIKGITGIYLRITTLSCIATFVYNALSGCLKAVGDSKTPLYFLTFASILNAILDLILIGGFHLGITCSAATTVVAQFVSAILTFLYIKRKSRALLPTKQDLVLTGEYTGRILSYGIPSAIQQAVQPIGKLCIQGQINTLSVDSITCANIITRIDEFAFIPEQGIAAAISTYIAQNRGAKADERIKRGILSGLFLEATYAIILAPIVYLLKDPLIRLFLGSKLTPKILDLGVSYLSIMAFFYILPAFTNGLQGIFRGFGKMYTTILGTFLQISIRTLMVYILTPRYDIPGMAYACMCGWLVMLSFHIPYSIYTIKKTTSKD